ncbi:MAG: AraC family transcriptional regulator, partial [Spirochaetaceae bacterium]|nr:AraC family transcriptional regulator [Spirochaetaceae bacterium]
LEFIVVLEGEMTYHVNDQVYPLGEGDGIFVNTNRLHFGAAEEPDRPRECVFLCLLLHPSLLRAHPYIENRFVNPLLYDNRFDALHFPVDSGGADDANAGFTAEAIERIKALAELTRLSPDDAALEAQSRFYDLVSLLFANTVALESPDRKGEGEQGKAVPYREDLAIKRMISFMHNHFSEKITLDDIARAGMVCKSKCCSIFKQSLHKSVFDYLLHYRVRQSLSLLTNETISITEAAYASGFSAASHYGEMFKRLLGMSPGEYRRRFRAGEPLPRM